MEECVILTTSLARRFEAAMRKGRAVLFSAPCGFGKTASARALLAGKRVCAISAEDPELSLPAPGGKWDVLLVDDLQWLKDSAEQEALCAAIRENPEKKFVLLTRGTMPGWLLPFQLAGVLTVLGPWDLALDRDGVDRLLAQNGIAVSDTELTAIHIESRGCALPLSLLARHLAAGEKYSSALTDVIQREMYSHFDELVFSRLDLETRRLAMELAPFEPFGPELARIVSGNSRAGELLEQFQAETSALRPERIDSYSYWPIFRRYLLWKLEREQDEARLRALYARGGLYYELNEDYDRALECYSRSGDSGKISELLVRNSELHPGLGHYDEMEPYYRMLPEREILSSPVLIQAMSMLDAMCMDYEGSERWYGALSDFASSRRRSDMAAREARSRLAWLDLALPQRSVEGMLDTFPKAFRLLKAKEIKLPSFSVTSCLPSLMNGGKDFSPWSRKDDLLYKTLKVPVETVLGRDGVCLADCAMAESKFEKGENVKDRMLSLMSKLSRIRRDGTPDIEFAVLGLLARTQIDSGRAGDAKQTLLTLRSRYEAEEMTRFLPNLDAMLCRVDMYLGNDTEVDTWHREKAPKDPQRLRLMKRYQYITQSMAELMLGDEDAALLTLAPLEPYCEACSRYLDSISLHLLRAVARWRQKDPGWRRELDTALDTAYEFRFIRPVTQYGAAVLPLVEGCGWNKDAQFLNELTEGLKQQAVYYPDFLRPRRKMTGPLSATERQVLRLICADKSNAEIGEALGIKLATVKVHVSHILVKLNVSRRGEAKTAAEKLRLI